MVSSDSFVTISQRTVFLLVLLLVSACSFTPLYESGGSADAMRAKLSGVEIAPIPDRLGQILHNQLTDRLGVDGTPRYRLTVELDQNSQGFGFRRDASVAQEELTVNARFQLVQLEAARTVSSGLEQKGLAEVAVSANGPSVVISEEIWARTSYDIVLSDFANVTQREDSARRLVEDLANRIERRLALYFSQNR